MNAFIETLNGVGLFAISWWGWIGWTVVGLFGIAWLWWVAYRRMVRKHFIQHLKTVYPDLTVTEEKTFHLNFESSTLGNGCVNLDNLYRMIGSENANSLEKEKMVFEKFLAGLKESIDRASRKASMELDGKNLMPRLLSPEHLAELQLSIKMPFMPLAGTNLSIAFVMDSESAVEYLHEQKLAELGVDLPTLHNVALENLRGRSPTNFARATIEKKSVFLSKSGDTYDAARLLLVPDQLRDNETLAAVISDRDTLGLIPMPDNGDYRELFKLAKSAVGPKLLDRPLRVSKNGFEVLNN